MAEGANVLATLTIELNAAGKVNVTGPLANRMLAYGMLETARDVIAAFQADQKVQPANAEDLRLLAGGKPAS
jgi:hypothetical protein